jgi:hypothetical protein
MDFNDLKRKAEAAREFAVRVRHMAFTLRLPTQHELEVEVARARVHDNGADSALLVRLRRTLMERAVVAWEGVTGADLAPEGGTDAVDLTPAAVGLLLDHAPSADAAAALYDGYVRKREERAAAHEAAEKNSLSASPGTSPAPMR